MIQTSLQTIVIYTGNDTADDFAYSFPTQVIGDILVKARETATGDETTLVAGTDYSVTGVGQPTGTVTLVDNNQDWVGTGANLNTGWTLHIQYNPAYSQLTRFRDLGRHAPIEFEKSLDKITQILAFLVSKAGGIAKSVKLPSKFNTDDFDPTLPDDIDTANCVIAVNEDGDGLVMGPSIATLESYATFTETAYTPGAVQTLGAGGTIVIAQLSRQHVRVQSSGGELALSSTPFGSNTALFQDGMEIVVEGVHDTNFLTLAENDANYGYIGNGGLDIKKVNVLTFIYNSTQARFKLKSLGVW